MNPAAIAAIRDLEKLAAELKGIATARADPGFALYADRILAAVQKLKGSARPHGGRR